jgi:hypothetical protein
MCIGEPLHDRCEAGEHVVAGSAVGLQNQLRDREGAGCEQQRVAVGRRLRDVAAADDAAGARAVVDHHRLPHPRRELLGEEPRQRIGVATRRIGDDQRDRLGGVALRPGKPGGAGGGQGHGGCNGKAASMFHGSVVVGVLFL